MFKTSPVAIGSPGDFPGSSLLQNYWLDGPTTPWSWTALCSSERSCGYLYEHCLRSACAWPPEYCDCRLWGRLP